MVQVPHRFVTDKLNLESVVGFKNWGVSAPELWVDNKTNSSLILKSNDEIETYVLRMVREYFMTTKKAKLTLNSKFSDHGLDSLDVIELIM